MRGIASFSPDISPENLVVPHKCQISMLAKPILPSPATSEETVTFASCPPLIEKPLMHMMRLVHSRLIILGPVAPVFLSPLPAGCASLSSPGDFRHGIGELRHLLGTGARRRNVTGDSPSIFLSFLSILFPAPSPSLFIPMFLSSQRDTNTILCADCPTAPSNSIVFSPQERYDDARAIKSEISRLLEPAQRAMRHHERATEEAMVKQMANSLPKASIIKELNRCAWLVYMRVWLPRRSLSVRITIFPWHTSCRILLLDAILDVVLQYTCRVSDTRNHKIFTNPCHPNPET